MTKRDFLLFVLTVGCYVLILISIADNNKEAHATRHICIGGYQYELVVNEFNEPVWCGENAE